MNKYVYVVVLMLVCGQALADQVYDQNTIIQGNACIGRDCVNGESFGEDILRLKDNNLRIAWDDGSGQDVVGRSWMLEFNSSDNGGDAYAQLLARSGTKEVLELSDGSARQAICDTYLLLATANSGYSMTEVVPAGQPIMVTTQLPWENGYLIQCQTESALSDGTAPNPVCDVVQGSNVPAANGVIPIGQPVITATASTESGFWVKYSCETVPAYSRQELFRIDVGADGNVLLGEGATAVVSSNVVSLGAVSMLRQLKNVAEAFNESDVLTVGELNALVDSSNAKLDELNSLVTLIAYIRDQSNTAPVEQDYANMGIVGLSETIGGAVEQVNEYLVTEGGGLSAVELKTAAQNQVRSLKRSTGRGSLSVVFLLGFAALLFRRSKYLRQR